ncbi:MAG TPA: copper chaperone PCu(A)C, partial [Oceanobacillus sp.]|nr:copper chaperone PCu(A)C [Oceanobacillus sp.]
WVALICGAAMLLVHAMNSHASAAQDVPVAVVNDWLHLLASSLWFGGLAGFVVVLPRSNLTAPQTGELVAAFSNYARAAVAALLITGLYSAWLHIGSVEALMGTAYGRALLVKSVLFAPLLVIAAVNLLLTRRALLAGKTRWNGWLRGLVGVEVTLLIGILAAAALMTAINPARGVQAMRTAVAAAPVTAEANPYFEMQTTDDVMAHLDIVPGTVGENTFAVTLIDLDTGLVIDDASLIRLRFNNREVGGQSELRPELQENGVYEASGTNLSIPGDWRIRMTIQRPGEFDKVLDFEATIQPPSTPPPPVIDTTIPLSDRGAAALLAGYGLLAIGGFFGAQTRLRRLLSGTGVLTVALVIAGAVSMVTGAALVYGGSGSITVRGAWARPAPAGATGAVYLTIDNTADRLARVIGAETEMAARVELHRTVIEGEIARMQPLDTLEVPPGETLRISPPGTHLMLVDLQDDLIEGETFPLTLTFESGEVVTLDVRVQMIAPE